jgi:ABC-2 type transport system permease protein
VTTVTAPARSEAAVSGRGGGSLTGTWTLVRLILRRDRVRIPVWLGALTLTTVGTALSFGDLYGTVEARQAVAGTMNTPAGIAMTGPTEYLSDYNIGSMMGHQMLGFTAVMVALMSVLLLVRHTRAEEETGRAELVRSNVVGRHAHLAAALVVVAGANLVLALLFGAGLAGLGLEGLDWHGSLLYGAAHAAVGVAFAGVAAVTVQITEHTRGASGMALAAAGLAYVLRAAGDVETQALSWLSPIGWAQGTYVYVENRWWPLLLAVALFAALVAAAMVLSTRRDVGAGLRQTRPGPAAAADSLVRPIGLAVRLHRGLLVGWAAALALLGVAYGSILGDVEAMLTDIQAVGDALDAIGGATLIDSFAAMVMTVLATISSVYVVLATSKARSEENAGRAEPLLATPLSRTRWLASHLAVAMAGGAIVLLLGGGGLGLTGALVLDDRGFLVTMVGAAAAYLPALWVTGGVTVALFGLRPRWTGLAWIVPVYAFVVGYLGQILQFPGWLQNLSPFGHVPALPASDFSFVPWVLLTVIAAALVAVGLAGFRRRDVNVP